jgi:SAM-dependent methyltransferase
LDFRCVNCSSAFSTPDRGEGTVRCRTCQYEYRYADKYLSYRFDPLLLRRWRKQYLLWKVLSNNGYVSYVTQPEASLSLPDRDDVRSFNEYVQAHHRPGKILDIGCGILELPGYIRFADTPSNTLYGLDPIDDRTFRGVRIVGCSEYTPFADGTIDTAIFATSLDHVCSLAQTIAETKRILRPGGVVIIWMSDRSQSPVQFVKSKLRVLRDSVRAGYRTDRYVVYPNDTVFYVPNGAVDPYHTNYENPRTVTRVLEANRLERENMVIRDRDHVFLTFRKAPPPAPPVRD